MMNTIKDEYGNQYELISGRTYKSKGEVGNIACYTESKRNNGLTVIWYGKFEQDIRKLAARAIRANGWNESDWL